ncbi:ATP-binding protein [Sulfuricurvum sp.]|uniref:sensor histidine kinase n=1 Tax=Sulfuricurvum sp. TaxID=2025608 RepID=UPI00261046E7|nr:ATP-binding protein [Sulfuricurvum sp.]MDD2265459.1 ATP-binding protein [Sulfuricurvum sp.]MDD2782884.1 ATP-binding protein [Sulfuricurvum sp.]
MHNEIFSKEVDALYRALPVPLAANLFNALIIIFVLHGHIADTILGLWMGANILVLLLRFANYYKFRFSTISLPISTAYNFYMFGIIASGLLWGSSAFYLLPDSANHAVILIIIVGGMVAGAVGSSSYRPESYIVYNLLVLTPFAVHFVVNNADASWLIGITILLFSLMMIISSKKFHANFSEVILLQLKQQELLDHLKEEKYYTEHLNENLLQEMIEKEQYQTDLIKALEEARQASIAKDAFFATMSHELRTPLNAIIGFSQILIHRPDTPKELSSTIEKILLSGKHLLELVNTILDFSKMKAGKMELHYTVFSVSELCKGISIIVEPLASKRSIQIHYPALRDESLRGDRQMIQQILINLLSNAIKFSPDHASIEVRYQPDLENRFSICDHGKGIAKENLETIFDPFIQIYAHNNESLKGTVLGLAIVKEMVQAHGGRIWAESTIGEGSCFYFTIPSNIT